MFRRVDVTSLIGATTLLAAACLPLSASAGDPVAAAAAANGAACNAARPFYWEIGDVNGVIVSGQVGGTLYNRNTRMNLASASKWPFGAYVLERYNGLPPAPIRQAMLMQAGYPQFSPLLCPLSPKVKSCFNIIGNNTHDPSLVGEFYYSGGNSQYVATSPALLDLGEFTTAQLTAELQTTIGTTMSYQYPALPAGLEASAAEYAAFLVKLMKPPANGGLVMHDYLGVGTVPTLPCPPGASGCTAAGTVAWSYGDHYWVEDNTVTGQFPNGSVIPPGDGAYSSAGAYGFSPWITADLETYGIVARRALLGTAYQASGVCGQAIRYAYTGYTPPP